MLIKNDRHGEKLKKQIPFKQFLILISDGMQCFKLFVFDTCEDVCENWEFAGYIVIMAGCKPGRESIK